MTRTRLIVFSTIILVAIGLCFQPAWSQGETGSIAGTVRDASGAVVPGAKVTAKSVGTGVERSVQSGTAGEYKIVGLIPGLYDVTVDRTGFAAFKARAEVTVGASLTLDAQLALSGQTTVVEVVGAGGTAVNTQSQELSQLIDTTQMTQLPSLNRDPYDFVALSGNVSNADQTSNGGAPNNTGASVGQNLTGYGVGYSINGQRETGTEILLDGVENIGVFSDVAGQPVPADSIQEFSIITNNFGAEYGRASGGIVNVDTKHGTNDIHGDAFEFNRLSAYTANTFGNVANGLPKGIYTRNQFGYDAGAPIIKNKLFAYFSEEFVRVRSDSSQTEEILDPSFVSLLPSNIQSYFAKSGTGADTPSGTVITAGQLAANSSVNSAFPTTGGVATFPMINGVTPVSPTQPVFDVVNFTAPFDAGGGTPQNTYDLVGRLDYNLSDKTQVFFRYARYSEADFPGSTFYSPYPQYDVGGVLIDNSALFSVSHVFNDHLLSSTKLSFARFDTVSSFDSALTQTPNLYLSTSSYAEQVDYVTGNVIQLPGLENTAEGSGGLPYGGPQDTLQVGQDFAWTRGRHTMHFGGEFTYIQLNIAYGAYFQSNEVLGSDLGPSINTLVNAGGDMQGGVFASPILQFEARVNAEGVLPCATDNFGNEIVTPACTVAPPLPSANPARSYRYKDWALYAGDSFKLTRRLTVNYALRYEHFGVQHNNHADLDSNFYDGPGSYPGNIADGGVFVTSQSPAGEFWKPRWGTLAPRVGFAYDIFGDGKTSLRGGYGISYERNFGNVTYNASFNPPSSAVLSDNCSASATGVIGSSCGYFVTNNDLGPLGLPGPSSALTPTELRDDYSNIDVAQTQFWSLALQRQVAPNALLEVSYSGARGLHLYDLNNINLIGAPQEYLGAPLVTTVSTSAVEQCPYVDPGATAAAIAAGTIGSMDTINGCYTRPNSQYAEINQRGSGGSSSYNALNVKFQTQNLHHTGLTLITNYTYAHSLDDLSTTFSDDLTQGSLGYTNFLNPRLDWGNSDFDVRHRIVISPIWETPWFKSGNGFEREALGGWTIASVFTAHTGIPFSIYDESYLVNYYVIPRLTPATPITDYHVGAAVPVAGQANLFTALNVPPPAPIGPLNPTLGISDFGPYPANMTGRGAFRGPGAWNDDLAISKNFKLTERFALQFRAEAFNLFNHHNFYINADDNYIGGPTTSPLQVVEQKGGLGSEALGGNHDERRFGQFALRLSF
jgi:Carboxypeptidase regulatory-like domain/TonB dependent receptor